MDSDSADRTFRVRLAGTDAQLRRLLAVYPGEPQTVSHRDGNSAIEMFMPEDVVVVLERHRLEGLDGLVVQRLYDADERGRALIKEVGVGNRFADGSVPSGLGVVGERSPP